MGKKTQEFYRQLDETVDELSTATEAVAGRVVRAGKARLVVSEAAGKITETQIAANKAYEIYRQDLHFCRFTIEKFNKSAEKTAKLVVEFEDFVSKKPGDSRSKAASVVALKLARDSFKEITELYLTLSTAIADIDDNLPPVQDLLKGRNQDSAPSEKVSWLLSHVTEHARKFEAEVKKGRKVVEEFDA